MLQSAHPRAIHGSRKQVSEEIPSLKRLVGGFQASRFPQPQDSCVLENKVVNLHCLQAIKSSPRFQFLKRTIIRRGKLSYYVANRLRKGSENAV